MDAGQQLFEARQRCGLTLDDISRTTKIPVSLLQALERNDMTRLPQPFFTRAFLRAYAKEIGVDADELFRSEPSEVARIERRILHADVEVDEPASPASVLFVALAAACSIYLGYALQSPPSDVAHARALDMVLVDDPVPHRGRGDITLPAGPAGEDAPTATLPRVMKAAASAPVDTAGDEATAADQPVEIPAVVESPPAISDAIVPQADPIASPAPVEPF